MRPARGPRAILLAGWLGEQLGWQVAGGSPWRQAGFQTPAGRAVAVTFHETAGPGIGKVVLRASEGGNFVVSPGRRVQILQHLRALRRGGARAGAGAPGRAGGNR